MKQMKFLLVALMTTLMGMSVTSCLKGNENTIEQVRGIIGIRSTFPYQFQVEGSDVVFEASSMTIPGLSSDASAGDIVLLESKYDRKTQAVDQNTKKIIVDVSAAIKLNDRTSTSSADVEYNRSIIPLSRYGTSLAPSLYSANWIIFPMPFYAEKEETRGSHSFTLVYDKTHTDNSESTMVLRLRHSSIEDVAKEKNIFSTYKAFQIASLVSAFQSTGNKLKTIKIIAQEQAGSTPEIKNGETKEYKDVTYIIDGYDKYVK